MEYDPLPFLERYFPYVANSAPFVVYGAYLSPLTKIHQVLTKNEAAVRLAISESWCREYVVSLLLRRSHMDRFQVLPGRTRPLNNMSGASGYILTGIKVESTWGQGQLQAFIQPNAHPLDGEPDSKRLKTTESSKVVSKALDEGEDAMEL